MLWLGFGLALLCRNAKWAGRGGAAADIRHSTAILTVSEEDVGGPVLSSRWVLEVIDERTDRLQREKEGNESNT